MRLFTLKAQLFPLFKPKISNAEIITNKKSQIYFPEYILFYPWKYIHKHIFLNFLTKICLTRVAN